MGRIQNVGSEQRLSSWLILAVVPAILSMASSTSPPAKVDPKFLGALRESKGKVGIIVLFADGTQQALAEFKNKEYETREERLEAVNAALKANAEKSQSAVQEFLRKKNPAPTWESKWINNSIFVKDADAALIDELAKFPEVSEIQEDKIMAKTSAG